MYTAKLFNKIKIIYTNYPLRKCLKTLYNICLKSSMYYTSLTCFMHEFQNNCTSSSHRLFFGDFWNIPYLGYTFKLLLLFDFSPSDFKSHSEGGSECSVLIRGERIFQDWSEILIILQNFCFCKRELYYAKVKIFVLVLIVGIFHSTVAGNCISVNRILSIVIRTKIVSVADTWSLVFPETRFAEKLPRRLFWMGTFKMSTKLILFKTKYKFLLKLVNIFMCLKKNL